MSDGRDRPEGEIGTALRVALIAGFFVLCLVTFVIPMAFGKPFGWYGRVWMLGALIVWAPVAALAGGFGKDRSIGVWELVRRSKGADVREPSREERREYRGRH